MKTTVRRIALCLIAAASIPALALTESSAQQLERIQGRWAEIHYKMPAASREAAFAELAQEADRAVAAEPKAAELHIWKAIVLSTWAGAKGELEQAMQLDAKALQGSAYTSLGSLYYQVPGWPIGFGDDKKAEAMLRQALVLNPDGIDPNYFYGDFLQRQKRYAEAKAALEKALAAADRPGRAGADAGRREEARQLLKTVQAKLG